MKKFFLLVAIFALLSFANGQNSDEDYEDVEGDNMLAVHTLSGTVLGMEVEDSDDSTAHFAFKGIPYAQPPINELRFMDPLPVRPWNNPRNATEFGPMCPQLNMMAPRDEDGNQQLVGDEDCLFLNVFTPRLPSNREGRQYTSYLPVMVYVHGGDWALGSGNQEGHTLTEQEVVYVSMNYRLNALGYLSLGSHILSGNMGMKDQLEALRWVQENIAAFGGDPNRVTIFGQSVGGTNVHMHQLSPLGGSLFHGVIAQSGSAPMFDYSIYSGANAKAARAYLNKTDCDDANTYKVLECLQEKPIEDLLRPLEFSLSFKDRQEKKEEGMEPIRFMPEIDPFATNPYMPDLPIERLRQGRYQKVPLIIGVVENDGAFFANLEYDNLDAINANWTEFAANSLYGQTSDELTEEQEMVAGVLRQFYTGGDNFTQDDISSLTNFFSDLFFERPASRSAEIQCLNDDIASVFFYRLTQKPTESYHSLLSSNTGSSGVDFGVFHSDDLLFLFGAQRGLDGLQSEETKKTAEAMRTIWTNFAKFQDPTPYRDSDIPVWHPFSCKDKEYLELKAEPEMKSDLHKERNYLWNKLYFDELERELKQKTLPSYYQPPAVRQAVAGPMRMAQLPASGQRVSIPPAPGYEGYPQRGIFYVPSNNNNNRGQHDVFDPYSTVYSG